MATNAKTIKALQAQLEQALGMSETLPAVGDSAQPIDLGHLLSLVAKELAAQSQTKQVQPGRKCKDEHRLERSPSRAFFRPVNLGALKIQRHPPTAQGQPDGARAR